MHKIKRSIPPWIRRALRATAWASGSDQVGFDAGTTFANKMVANGHDPVFHEPPDANPLRTFFDQRTSGPGIWKWLHYFDIYHRHLAPFRGRTVNMVEIGVYSGGSLDMWLDYFGDRATIHGVDIAPECRQYASDRVKISIGDQADPGFWRHFKQNVPRLDVVIDDGGHEPRQQMVTLQELLPHLSPGGVYICEDIHGSTNRFAEFTYGLADQLNSFDPTDDPTSLERRLVGPAHGCQVGIESVCLYPFIAVITRTKAPVREFIAAKHGDQWQPFLR